MSICNVNGVLSRSCMPMPNCPECLRLDKEYKAAIADIRRLVNGHLPNPQKKIFRLRRMQDARDTAIQRLYSHIDRHNRGRYVSRLQRESWSERAA
jgi:hypothetical protein